MTLEVSSTVIDTLLAEADRAAPEECCGLLFGDAEKIDAVTPASNVHRTPQSHFEIDPQALIDAYRRARAGEAQIAGFYHSHPNGIAEPSATDRALAARDGMIWAIVAAGRVTFWRSGDAGFEALPYVVSPR
ncbi:MAG: M67 family metallopeptidase [Erythrobacter sp.]